MTLFRCTFFVLILILILELGAFLSGEYIAVLGGIIACLMFTVSPDNIKIKNKINSWLFYLGAIAIFLVLSYVDMIL